jgi:tRNA threonylcarbamoyladenosine biosynthesis protein TsaE
VNKKIIINSKEEMVTLAQNVADDIGFNSTIALIGSLGAGKSFFAKNFINYLQQNPTQILSPTFNLVYSYPSKKGEIFHFDLYRLKDIGDLENIGFFDVLNRFITIIEWPQIAEKYLTKNCLKITINNISGDNHEAREIIIKSE